MAGTQTITQRKTTTAPVQTPKYDRVPSVKPPFTVGDIRRAIPAHCFTRPLLKSFTYLFVDLAIVAVLYYLSTFIEPTFSAEKYGEQMSFVLRHACWVLYWCCQGCVMTGLWVIGHECGHGGFADSQLINDAVGLIVHSALLVPYFCWAISHRRHHSNTGSIEHDEVFVPTIAEGELLEKRRAKELAGKNVYDADHEHEGFMQQTIDTINRLFYIVVMLTVGWPGYLAANISGNKSYDYQNNWVNHFFPSSPIYTNGLPSDKENQRLVLISDVALLAVIAALTMWSMAYGFTDMLYSYFIPYLITNLFLVLITFLQHTHLALPHYVDGEWDWLRGALATVDRDYGFLNVVFHHITDTHVVHHLFSSMPHYHAMEATNAVKGMLGKYYRYDDTPIVKALWDSWRDCQYVYPDPASPGVHWY